LAQVAQAHAVNANKFSNGEGSILMSRNPVLSSWCRFTLSHRSAAMLDRMATG
jgi:hypothetical protein